MLAHLDAQEGSRGLTVRSGQELAPGVWSDPLSESRHDYDGAQAGYEAEIAKARNVAESALGFAAQANSDVADTMWDAALEIAAHIVESDDRIIPGHSRECVRKIRSLKKQR
jgi:hypothetical protein